MDQNRRGHLFALVAAILFGAGIPASKGLLDRLTPWVVAGLLYVGSGGGLAILMLLRNRLRPDLRGLPLRRIDLPWLAGSTLFGGILAPLMLVAGLSLRDSASASLLQNTEGVFTAALAWLVFREARVPGLILSWVAILAGSLLLGWNGGHVLADGKSAVLILGSSLAWAIDNNLTKRITERDVLQISSYKGLVASLVNVSLALYFGTQVWTPAALGYGALTVLVGFVSYGLGLLSFLMGLRYLGAARTAAYFGLAPFIGAGLAVAFGQSLLTWQIGGACLLMAVGLWVHQRAEVAA